MSTKINATVDITFVVQEKQTGSINFGTSIGGLMVTGAYSIAVTYGQSLPEIAGSTH